MPEPDHVAGQFGLGTILNRPVFLTRSDWLEHIPFAFWLMEAQKPRTFVELGTQDGASYFAFCQAAEQLAMDVDCFAIAAWGAEAAEAAGPARLRQHNEAHYSAFSRLQAGDMEEAAQYFADTPVDLLHIDGFTSLHRARACFDSWLPMLSSRAVVLLHNSDVRASGHGVSQLARSLSETYPTFRFRHGNGLAVIGVGPDQPDTLSRLFEANDSPAARTAIQTIFSRLGRACGDSYLVHEYQELYYKALDQIETLLGPSGAQPAPRPVPAPGTTIAPRSGLDTRPQALDRGAATGSDPGSDPDPRDQELETLRNEVAMQRAGAQARFEEIAALTQMIQALEAERHSQSPTADWERQKQKKSLAALKAEIAQKDQELADWQRMYNEMRNSTSWRISRPVRWIGNLRRR